ncbi:MAG: exodeoxyribonuclease VII large subunit [Tannerellaceae bacterium]|jgi:exodeoxyribonuclease VII large subunit|nr:exodeoxyribonuclease VII large subunit [Tannerellaceae bacterium]
MNTNNKNEKREELTLAELAHRIKNAIAGALPGTYWVRAETSDVRINPSGHCYLELIEKNERTGQISAKIRASIWASTFYKIKYSFESIAGQPFASGIKILIKAKADYHELYGLSLNIIDIDPAYTIGDMIRRRLEIIRRLQEDGVFTLNKELPLPILPNRIAIISSPTAAGYGDFVNQLENNSAGYVFYHRLFTAVMQGEKTETSIIAALENIFNHADLFDLTVIIRGGGATSELSSFDAYNLAAHCAQFPLPILTGIGHDRDETVLDMVAHKMLKTPTAVAEYLINRIDQTANEQRSIQQTICATFSARIQKEKQRLHSYAARIPSIVIKRLDRNRTMLNALEAQLPVKIAAVINKNNTILDNAKNSLLTNTQKHIAAQKHALSLAEQFIQMASPDYNLKRGYTLTLKNGIIVKRASALSPGDEITTHFIDGDVKSHIPDNDANS